MKYQLVVALVVCPAVVPGQMRTDTNITGQNAPKGIYALSFDDGPDDVNPTGRSATEQIAELLGNGLSRFGRIPATFFMVPCHFIGSGIAPDAKSSQCKTSGTLSPDLIAKVLQFGHDIGNHSAHHMVYPNLDPTRVLSETDMAADFLAQFENGRHLFRFPGFSTNPSVINRINANGDTANLNGPYGADFDGAGYVNGTFVAGDFDCFTHMFDPATCGDVYLRQIAAAPGGGIILFHDRPEGSVGSQYAFKLVSHILDGLPADTKFVSLRTMVQYQPGALPNTPMQLTSEFGGNDGYGDAVFGDLNGSGKQGACKARAGGVWCALSDSFRLLPARLWLSVQRATTGTGHAEFTPGQSIWLADVDGDGRADLVWEGPLGIYVAVSGGKRFESPSVWLKRRSDGSYPHVSDGSAYSILFGDFNGDGKKELLFWTTTGLLVSASENGGFGEPAYWSRTDFGAPAGWTPQSQGMRAGDINRDGKDDVCVRNQAGVTCAISDGQSFGAAARIAVDQFGDVSYPYFTLADAAGTGARTPVAMRLGAMLFSETDGTRLLPPQTLNLNASPAAIAAVPMGFADWNGDGKDKPYWMTPTGIFGSLTQGIVSALPRR